LDDKEYNELVDKVTKLIPKEEYKSIMSQDMCELDHSFLGFLEVYNSVLSFVPKHYTIVDLGCYMAAQAYLFKDYQKYIGVDVCLLNRFKPLNTEHYYCSIQQFIENHINNLNLDTTFAICSFVPDFKSVELARRTFKNILVYYPSGIRVDLTGLM
jgi:hypothetical protein